METKAFWLAFNQVSGIGPARLSALLEQCGHIEGAWRASVQEMQSAGLDRRTIEALLEARSQIDLASLWAEAQKAGVSILTWDDATYPEILRQTPAAPPVLFVRGSLTRQDEGGVAIVGTRRASAYGREVAHTFATALARNGITVVSGLALGVDSVAHQAALDAGGRTIAVLGSGVDQIYPQRNLQLAQRMIEHGALVSDYRLGARPEAGNFPARNRIISGLSKGVIVVEAGERSGALITARFAAEQGRDVFAVPGSIFHPGSAGCNRLIQDGATPALNVDDILAQLNLTRHVQQTEVRSAVPTTADEQEILTQLSAEPCHIDSLVRQLSLPAQQVTGLLTMMELKGLVRQVDGNRYVRG